MSAEAEGAMKLLGPGLGVTGIAGVLLLQAATGSDLAAIKEYGSMVLLAGMLVWMTQVLSKKLDKLDKLDQVNAQLTEVKGAVDSQTRETTEVRATLERQDRRLEKVEAAIKDWGGE